MTVLKKWYVEIQDTKIYAVEVEAANRQEAKIKGPEVLREGRGRIVGYRTRVVADIIGDE